MSDNVNELVAYLKKLGLEDISKSEKKVLLDMINKGNTLAQIKMELELLFSLNKVLLSSYIKVSLTNMMAINKDIDTTLIVKLFMVYNELKNKCKDETECLRQFKGVVSDILGSSMKVNGILDENVGQVFNKSIQVKNSLYLTMIDRDKADKLFDNCVKRSKTFLAQCDVYNLEKLMICLKKNYKLTDDELVSISKRCATFFAFSSAAKIDNLFKTINNFKGYIEENLKISDKKIDCSKLLNKDFKDVLINSSSVAVVNSDSIQNTVKFLMGSSLGELVKDHRLKDVRGNFTPVELAKIYNESITSLSISVEKIVSVCDNVSECYKNCFGVDLNINKLINGHNFCSLSQLSKEDYISNGKLREIFGILNMFISKEDIEILLKNDFSFLIASVNDVKKSLKYAVLNSQNKDELRKNVLQKIRNHFDMYGSYYYFDASESSNIRLGSLGKVNIKDLNDNEMDKIFESLNVSVNDIDEWKKNWNKEEKDLRNLQIQIDLEDMAKDLKDIESLLCFNFVDIEQFVNETIICKGLLMEVIQRYDELVIGKKLNKDLSLLSDTVFDKIASVKDQINNNICYVVGLYNDQLSEINNKVLSLKDKEDKYLSMEKEMKDIEKMLEGKNLSGDAIAEKEKEIDSVFKFLKDVKAKQREIKRKEDAANVLVSKFFDMLYDRNTIVDVLKKVENNENEMNPETIFILFAKVLYDEGLIDYVDELDEIEEGEYDVYDYSTYKYEYLREKEIKITDEIYALYSDNKEARDMLFVQLLSRLDEYKVENNDISSINDAYSLLDMCIHDVRSEHLVNVRVFNRLNNLKESYGNINIEEIRDNITKLEESMAILKDTLASINNEQIKR